MRHPSVICLCAFSLWAAPALADVETGRKLVAQHCTGCHDASVYTRKNRKMDSLSRLQSQVERCDTQLETRLFGSDIDDIVDFLNREYYHFAPAAP